MTVRKRANLQRRCRAMPALVGELQLRCGGCNGPCPERNGAARRLRRSLDEAQCLFAPALQRPEPIPPHFCFVVPRLPADQFVDQKIVDEDQERIHTQPWVIVSRLKSSESNQKLPTRRRSSLDTETA